MMPMQLAEAFFLRRNPLPHAPGTRIAPMAERQPARTFSRNQDPKPTSHSHNLRNIAASSLPLMICFDNPGKRRGRRPMAQLSGSPAKAVLYILGISVDDNPAPLSPSCGRPEDKGA
jgi:hypothetical protein